MEQLFNKTKYLIEQKAIDEQIKLLYKKSEEEELYPIFDGIINYEKYLNSKPRLLWILKEPYDNFEDGKPFGGNWSYTEAIDERSEAFRTIKTWRRIAYTTYGVLNNCFYDYMDDIDLELSKDCRVFDSLKQISIINIKKTPGQTHSNYNEIKEAYEISSDILIKQIDLIQPEVIIGGGTLTFFMDDLELAGYKKEGHGLKYFIKDNILFIDAAHPSFPKGNAQEEEYVDEIVSVYRDYRQSKS